MIEVIPTCTSPQTLDEIEERIGRFKEFSRWVQLDLDDGDFAPMLSWPYHEGQWEELEQCATGARHFPHGTSVRYEAHLMVEDPVRIGELLSRAGVARILAHIEVFDAPSALRDAFVLWKNAGAHEVGVVARLDTDVSVLAPVLDDCDAVQLMSIRTLGSQGATFDPRVTERIKGIHSLAPQLIVAVDGGVSEKNIGDLVRAGATRFGVGSAIEKSEDPAESYRSILSAAESALQ
jgi:ribulose-phosphate 3-epimerase